MAANWNDEGDRSRVEMRERGAMVGPPEGELLQGSENLGSSPANCFHNHTNVQVPGRRKEARNAC